MSATAVRRLAVSAQGFAGRYRRATGAERRGRDPPALVRPARLDLDGRAEPPDRPRRAASATTRRRRSRGCSRAAGSSSTGRTRPACSRSSCGRSSGRRWRTAAAAGTGPSARRTPTSPSEILAEIRERGPLASRHFEGATGGGMWNWKPAKAMLEAALEPRRPRDRGPTGLPARLRPGRAGDSARAARRAGSVRARAAAHARRARRSARAACSPTPASRSTGGSGAASRGCGRRSTSWSPRGGCDG